MLLEIKNHGAQIVSTNFWRHDLNASKKFYVSVNAGHLRLLVPKGLEDATREMQTGKFVIGTIGFWKESGDTALELVFEDHTESPFSLVLDNRSVDVFPNSDEDGWIFTAWVCKNLKHEPKKALERKLFLRRAIDL